MSHITGSDIEFDFNDDDDSDELSINFQNAAHHVQLQHLKYTPAALLELYALYKQATVGRCNVPKPGILQIQARSKWSAWHDLGDLTKSDAQQAYISKVKQIDPDFVQRTAQHQQKSTQLGWAVHSIEQQPEDPDANKPEHEKTAWDYVKEKNLARLKEVLRASDLRRLDAYGMALIHWATDRNDPEILRYLLAAGADVNHRDTEQQTPLHYAASCGHVDVTRVLVEHKADTTLEDYEGHTCHEVAADDEVLGILNNN